MPKTDQRKPDRAQEGRHGQCTAQGLAVFREAGDEWQGGEARHRRNRADDADPGGIDADRAQPDREKR